MADDEAFFRPQNVTEGAAEGYLIGTGWRRAYIDPQTWTPPEGGQALSRGQAVPMLDAFKAEATEAVGLAGHPKEEFVWKVIRQYIPPDTCHRAEDDWYMRTDDVFDFLEDLAKAILPIAEP